MKKVIILISSLTLSLFAGAINANAALNTDHLTTTTYNTSKEISNDSFQLAHEKWGRRTWCERNPRQCARERSWCARNPRECHGDRHYVHPKHRRQHRHKW